MRINSKRLGVVASALAFGLGVALTASSARADLGLEDEYTVILIDASGSMRDQAAGYSTPWSKWKEAISRAKEFVNQQRLGTLGYSTDTGWDPENATVSPPGSRGTYAKYNQCYQIWQFGNKEFTKIYPTDGGNASGFQCMDQTDDTARTVSYAKVTNALGNMVEPADEFVMTPLAVLIPKVLPQTDPENRQETA